MSEAHDNARATLTAIASSPDAVAASQAHLFAAVDAMVAVHCIVPPGVTGRQASLRTPRAAWAAILAHAEHRLHVLNREATKP